MNGGRKTWARKAVARFEPETVKARPRLALVPQGSRLQGAFVTHSECTHNWAGPGGCREGGMGGHWWNGSPSRAAKHRGPMQQLLGARALPTGPGDCDLNCTQAGRLPQYKDCGVAPVRFRGPLDLDTLALVLAQAFIHLSLAFKMGLDLDPDLGLGLGLGLDPSLIEKPVSWAHQQTVSTSKSAVWLGRLAALGSPLHAKTDQQAQTDRQKTTVTNTHKQTDSLAGWLGLPTGVVGQSSPACGDGQPWPEASCQSIQCGSW